MSKKIIIVNTPVQDDNTIVKQCIDGEYPNWCVMTEQTKLGESFREWWERKQEELGDKLIGIYLYDIKPIGDIVTNYGVLHIRYDYIRN